MTLALVLRWAGFVAAFVVLDAVSYAHGFHGLAISPWNPNSGLAVAMLLRHGWGFVPVAAVAGLVADQVVRGIPLAVSVPTEMLVAGIYGLAAHLLTHRMRVALPVDKPRHLTVFVATILVAALAVTLVRIGLAWRLPQFEPDWVVAMLVRQWVGDLIGISLFAPIFLRLDGMLGWHYRRWSPSLERLGQFTVTLAVSALVFGFEATDEFQYFYLLFLPVIWLALRGGMGATLAAMAFVQVAMMAGTFLRDMADDRVAHLQFLMLTLVLTGTLMAATAEARRKAELAIRTRMDELARLSRIHTSNEIASGIAHELKQPMLAIVNYVGAACRLLEKSPPQLDEALRLMRNTDTQVMRADAIIRRMRDFTRKAEFRMEPVDLSQTIDDAVELVEPLARRNAVSVSKIEGDGVPPVMADGVQVLQVVVNLLTNAIHAIAEADSPQRIVWVELEPDGPGHVVLTVCDTGPGLDAEVVDKIFEPFVTTRDNGIGVGLAISHAIAEAHGGRLWLDPSQPGGGAIFKVRLPIEASHESV